jgi:hypothetical protein
MKKKNVHKAVKVTNELPDNEVVKRELRLKHCYGNVLQGLN